MINKERLLSLFTRLIAIDSPSRGERTMCDTLKALLADIGIGAHEDGAATLIGGNAGNLYARVDGDIDLPPLLFSAHMDTVEPSRGKRAVIHPDGTITSGGTTVLGADDISGVAAIFEALYTIRENGLSHRPLELLFDVSEETYGDGIKNFDFSRLASKEVYVLDLSGPVGGAANRAPTLISFSARFTGRAAHAAFSPENGVHAVKAAAAAVADVECGRIGNVTVNIGTIRGGTADNIVPDGCTVTGEVRSLSDEDALSRAAAVEKTLRAAAEKFGAQVEISMQKHLTAYDVPVGHPVVRRFQSACRSVGLTPDIHDTYGGSDNNFFVPNGVTGIVAAAGMNDCHSCGEYSSVEELARAAELVLALMLSRE